MKIRDMEWINAVLQNDETATDRELTFYFMGNGLTQEEAQAVVSQRIKALMDKHYEVKL